LKWGDTVVCYNADFTGNLQLKTNRENLEKKTGLFETTRWRRPGLHMARFELKVEAT